METYLFAQVTVVMQDAPANAARLRNTHEKYLSLLSFKKWHERL